MTDVLIASIAANIFFFFFVFFNIRKKWQLRDHLNTLQNRNDYLRAQNARLEEIDSNYKHILTYFND